MDSTADVKTAVAAAFRAVDADDAETPRALAMACMFLGQGATQAQMPDDFGARVQQVIELAASDVPDVRKNALALLTAIMNNVEGGADLVDPLPTLRRVWPAIEARQEDDVGTLLNGIYCIAELATAPPCHDMFFSSVLPTVVKAVKEGGDARVQEAGLHAICKCLSEDRELGPRFSEHGVMAAVTPCCHSETPDIQVRAMMLLAMLAARDAAAQQQLAQQPGFVQHLVKTMRGGGGGDADAQALARDLFRVLSASPEARPLVEAALRSEADAASNFV